MGKDIEKKSYNGYSFTDGVKFESAYNGDYTAPTEPTEPVEVPFGEMYFGQTEGVRPTISYKAPYDVAWIGPKPEPGPGPEQKKFTVTHKATDCTIDSPSEGEYSAGTSLKVIVSVKKAEGEIWVLEKLEINNVDHLKEYETEGSYTFEINEDVAIIATANKKA